MRWILVMTLLCAALAVRADGFAYGKSFLTLHESDQAAVIDMDENSVDVSMYIAINGIPEGETITYVLPFWYRPDDFTMKEMKPREYRSEYIVPAGIKVARMNRIAHGGAGMATLMAASYFGMGLAVPLLLSPFTTAMERAHQGSSPNSAPLKPYEVQTTAHARAELYKIKAKDLQQLVAQAGLPAQYAEPLKKYKTPYFAVMRLAGAKQAKDEQERPSLFGNQGVCYTFRHPVPPDRKGEYTYPLGTGAAWSKPVGLTEVYVSCPDAWTLQVKAPVAGKQVDYGSFYTNLRTVPLLPDLELSDSEKEEYLSPMTTGLLDKAITAPSAWQIAYFNSNPSDDIVVKMTPRFAHWRLRFVESYKETPGLAVLFAGGFMLLSWILAAFVIIRPHWQRAGRPGWLIEYIIRTMVVVGLWSSLTIVPVFLLGSVVSNLTSNMTLTSTAFTAIIAGIGLTLAMLGFTSSARKAKSPQQPSSPESSRNHMRLHSWLLATSVYLVLNTGMYLFIRWCESAV